MASAEESVSATFSPFVVTVVKVRLGLANVVASNGNPGRGGVASTSIPLSPLSVHLGASRITLVASSWIAATKDIFVSGNCVGVDVIAGAPPGDAADVIILRPTSPADGLGEESGARHGLILKPAGNCVSEPQALSNCCCVILVSLMSDPLRSAPAKFAPLKSDPRRSAFVR